VAVMVFLEFRRYESENLKLGNFRRTVLTDAGWLAVS